MTQWGNLSYWQGETQMAGSLLLGYYCNEPGDTSKIDEGVYYSDHTPYRRHRRNPERTICGYFTGDRTEAYWNSAPAIWAKERHLTVAGRPTIAGRRPPLI